MVEETIDLGNEFVKYAAFGAREDTRGLEIVQQRLLASRDRKPACVAQRVCPGQSR